MHSEGHRGVAKVNCWKCGNPNLPTKTTSLKQNFAGKEGLPGLPTSTSTNGVPPMATSYGKALLLLGHYKWAPL